LRRLLWLELVGEVRQDVVQKEIRRKEGEVLLLGVLKERIVWPHLWIDLWQNILDHISILNITDGVGERKVSNVSLYLRWYV
jgi:hypothetical protein